MAKKNKSKQDSIEKELSGINDAAGDLMESAFCASAFKMYGELRSRARAEGQLSYYVFGTFFQMTLAERLLQFETVRERAVELIAIFEDEEQARKIEPSLDLDQYENMIYSMGACAYEVLAEATGALDGFNSEGMQECLTGGIEVCHRIGKLSCIQCFREYACDTHTAADDYELARYHCNQVLNQTNDFPERGDRRWLAMLRLATMDIFEGQHDAARAKLEQAYELALSPNNNDTQGALVAVMLERHSLDLIEDQEIDSRTRKVLKELPPRGECPEYDLDIDLLTSVGHIVNEEWDQAEKLLVQWNKTLKQSKAITKWLETGIRLVALYRLRGDFPKAKRLCVQFEEAATKANDWQSIRRLHQIMDDSIDITPLGTVVKNTRSPTALPQPEPVRLATEPTRLASDTDDKTKESLDEKEQTPLGAWMDDLTDRMHNLGKEAEKNEMEKVDIGPFRQELLDRPIKDFVHPEDIGRALYLMHFLVTADCDRGQVWKWANTLVSTKQDVAYLISLLARLGMTISMLDRLTAELDLDGMRATLDGMGMDDSNVDGMDGMDDLDLDGLLSNDDALDEDDDDDDIDDDDEFDPDEFDRDDLDARDHLDGGDDGRMRERALPPTSISNDRLEQLVRKSLQMDATGVNNNFRAAEVFEYIGNAGEAERCYARAFKLDRTRDDAALALSRIYSETDRLQDALYVLDLCIREGGDSGELLFEAALKAHALTQHELQVSFLQKLHERHAPSPWTNYYLSSGLLELKRPQEAMDAIEREVVLFQSSGLHIDSVRAAAHAQLGQSEEAIKYIQLALSRPLSKITDLTLSGVSGAYERLITAAKMCPDQKELQLQVERKMLVAGIATESYFEQVRANEKPCDLFLYQCYISQPLDDAWPDSDGCMPDQREWQAYIGQWGVLARDAEEAERVALEWQAKCYPIEGMMVDMDGSDDTLHDRPGIAFQGPRFQENEDMMDDGDDDDEEGF